MGLTLILVPLVEKLLLTMMMVNSLRELITTGRVPYYQQKNPSYISRNYALCGILEYPAGIIFCEFLVSS
jgi:hypothetical protein